MGRESLVVETYLHRGLAVFRIGLCIALLWTLFAWWPDFDFFFTRLGPLPLSALAVDTPPGTVAWSLYNASTETSWPYLLYGLTLLMSAVLLLGWRTEQAGPLLFVLLWSLQSRTAVACDLRDGALLLGLLFGCLTPWGKVWACGVHVRREGLWVARGGSSGPWDWERENPRWWAPGVVDSWRFGGGTLAPEEGGPYRNR